jgi:hydrocephalus-inducing protein
MVQRFHTNITLSERPSEITNLIAPQVVELGPLGSKDVHMRFFSYKEGMTRGTVKFENADTAEYVMYELEVETTGPEPLEVIHLETPVRQSARYTITVDNPLHPSQKVTFANDFWLCTCPVVRLRAVGDMSGKPEGAFEVEYRPLVRTQQPEAADLMFRCEELGTYKYKLELVATDSLAAATLYFDVSLGGWRTEAFTFHAYNTAPITFTASLEHGTCFSAPENIFVDAGTLACTDACSRLWCLHCVDAATGWEGHSQQLPIQFEPTQLGEIQDTLTLRSDSHGEYTCQLVGTCKPPLPQGPFTIAIGERMNLPFRNAFELQKNFVLSVDDAAFELSSTRVTISPKTEVMISVKASTTASDRAPITGQLLVRCEGDTLSTPWVFYLRAIRR